MITQDITEEMLIGLGACEDGIDFAKRNKLLPLPVKVLEKITGDYKNYLNWIKCSVKYNSIEKCSNGYTAYKTHGKVGIMFNILPVKTEETSESQTKTKEFDSKGNIILEKYNDVIIDKYDYEYHNNNIIRKYKNNQLMITYEYDEDDKLVEEYDYELKCTTKYEHDGDVIISKKLTFSNDLKIVHEYDELGRPFNEYSNSGESTRYEYDGNRIHSISVNDTTIVHNELVLDKNDNEISSYMCIIDKGSRDVIHSVLNQHPSEFYDNGQLKSIDDLEIPFIER